MNVDEKIVVKNPGFGQGLPNSKVGFWKDTRDRHKSQLKQNWAEYLGPEAVRFLQV